MVVLGVLVVVLLVVVVSKLFQPLVGAPGGGDSSRSALDTLTAIKSGQLAGEKYYSKGDVRH